MHTRMHIHISLPRRLRSGMRSIARRIESGPTRGRERPGANEGESGRMEETCERTGRRKREGDSGKSGRERREKKGEIERKIPSEKIAREKERTRRAETRRDEEAGFARVGARTRQRKRKRGDEVEELEDEENRRRERVGERARQS